MFAALLLSLALFAQAPEGRGQRPGGGGGGGGQQPATTTTTTTQPGGGQTGQRPQGAPTPTPEEPPVVTHHSITVGGRELKYTATTGMMPIKNRDGETEARMFFVAYTLDGVENRSQRALTFSFNGGPGSASVWLHMGCIGPRRGPVKAGGTKPPPPYHLVDKQKTRPGPNGLLFIHPGGTRYHP